MGQVAFFGQRVVFIKRMSHLWLKTMRATRLDGALNNAIR
jgi:hypothetical protein